MKLTLWVTLAFTVFCLALQGPLQEGHVVRGILDANNVTRRWNNPPPGPASDDVWENARCKGENLYYAFFQPSGSMPVMNARQWTLPDARTWGYHISNDIDLENRNLGAPDLPASHYGIARALRELGKSDKDRQDGGGITVCKIFHFDEDLYDEDPPIEMDDQTYTLPAGFRAPLKRRCTGSMSYWGYSILDGVIINLNIKSTVAAAKEREPPVPRDQLPGLRTLSDLQWAVWSGNAQGAPINKLEWYFVASIINEETREIIRAALYAANNLQGDLPLQPWPGRWIPMTEPGGLAILGSPLGKTLGYFLVQHKQQLGNLWIDGVVVFRGDTDHEAACLAFHIEQPSNGPH